MSSMLLLLLQQNVPALLPLQTYPLYFYTAQHFIFKPSERVSVYSGGPLQPAGTCPTMCCLVNVNPHRRM